MLFAVGTAPNLLNVDAHTVYSFTLDILLKGQVANVDI